MLAENAGRRYAPRCGLELVFVTDKEGSADGIVAGIVFKVGVDIAIWMADRI